MQNFSLKYAYYALMFFLHNNNLNQSLTYTKDYFKKYTLFIRKKNNHYKFLSFKLKIWNSIFFILFRFNLKEKKMFNLTKGSLKVNNKSKIIINLF